MADPADDAVLDLDPDARFLLANEHTLLAWIRTALTLQAGGLGVLEFASEVEARGVIGVGLLLLGAAAGLAGYRRYRGADADTALRAAAPARRGARADRARRGRRRGGPRTAYVIAG